MLDWRTWLGPLLALLLGLLDAALRGTRLRLADPGDLYVVAVVVATLLGGITSGVAAAIMGSALLLGIHWDQIGSVPLVAHVAIMMICVPIFGAVGRMLRRTSDRRIRRVAALRVLEHYRTLLEDLGTIVWEFDATEQRLTAVSESIQRVLGYSLDEWMRSPDMRLRAQHPDDVAHTGEISARLVGGTGMEAMEHRMIAADGRVVWLQTAMRASKDAEGHVILRGVAIDITAHKRAEAELQGALSLLTATLDSTDNGILVVDLDGRISSFNRKFVEMWDLPEEIVRSGEDARAVAHSMTQLTDPEGWLSKVQELYRDREATSFDVLEFKDGRVWERYSQPQRIGGVTAGRVWSFRDVSERVRAERALRSSEEQLRQAQKMEAVGQLAGGVAHDFNNILTAVLGNLSLILDDPAVPPSVRERAEEIQLASERAANLTRQLLAFGRRQLLAPRVEYMSVVVLEMLKLLRLSAGDRIEIALDLVPEPCPVLIDRGQMEQVILNLAINARDAMPTGGTITIATRLIELDEIAARDTIPFRAGKHVLLRVRDTGFGMDATTQARIFEPFFTTKDRGRGTGLGLATAYGIVQQSGGSIHVRSAPGQGSTFDIYLPWTEHEQARSADGASDAPRAQGIETVLIVEDEPQVRSLMREALVRTGYRVLDAPNGGDGLELGTALPGRLDLLVTDIAMPGLDGPGLSAKLRESRPGLRVMYVTGYAEFGALEEHRLEPGAVLLRKPFTMETLVRRAREALDGMEGLEG